MIKRNFEKVYGSTIRSAFKVVNPIKKKMIKTKCLMHKFLNEKSLQIMKKNEYLREYNFYKNFLYDLNEGATWIDQDFKSINHFYHFEDHKGLFGFSNALSEALKYYAYSIKFLKKGQIHKSIFYLGAVSHLIQDMTIPHHVNNNLLKQHRKFEQWIITQVIYNKKFFQDGDIIRYSGLKEYIIKNAIEANNSYIINKYIINIEDRFERMASHSIYRAEGTTTGFLLDFYNNEVKRYWVDN